MVGQVSLCNRFAHPPVLDLIGIRQHTPQPVLGKVCLARISSMFALPCQPTAEEGATRAAQTARPSHEPAAPASEPAVEIG